MTSAFLLWLCGLLLAPAGAAPSARDAAVPFTLGANGAVVVQVWIGEHGPFAFLLDTGSTHSAISEAAAARLGLTPVAKSAMTTSAGTTMVPVVRIETISAGGASATALLASVLTAAQLDLIERPLDGLLGQDFLATRNFTVDYRRRRITWDDLATAAARPAAGTVRLPLVMEQGRFVTTLGQENDGPALRLVPDTGSDGLVLYDTRAVAALRLDRVSAAGIGVDTLAGSISARQVRVRQFNLGPLTLRDRTGVLVARGGGASVDGLLPVHGFSRVSFRPLDGELLIEP